MFGVSFLCNSPVFGLLIIGYQSCFFSVRCVPCEGKQYLVSDHKQYSGSGSFARSHYSAICYCRLLLLVCHTSSVVESRCRRRRGQHTNNSGFFLSFCLILFRYISFSFLFSLLFVFSLSRSLSRSLCCVHALTPIGGEGRKVWAMGPASPCTDKRQTKL